MEKRCRITSGGGDPRESAAEIIPPVTLLRCGKMMGKGEMVG